MQKLIFIEAVSPRGHITINKFYIKNLNNILSRIYIGHSLINNYSDIKKVALFNDENLNQSRLLRAIGFVFNTCKILYKVKNKNTIHVCLLSYDPSTLFLVVYFAKFFRIKLYAFEHNTVPNDKWNKYIFQYMCFNWIKRVCYTPSSVRVYNKMKQEAIYIPHPIIDNKIIDNKSDKTIHQLLKTKRGYEFIVFCPSSSASINKILLKAKEHHNFLFIIKTKKRILLDNVITMEYFKDYNKIIEMADFFYLPVDLDNRVSGPFFEAIGAGKKIILQKGSFYDYAIKHFNSYILNDEDSWDFNTLIDKKINIKQYNSNIVKQLKEYFNA